MVPDSKYNRRITASDTAMEIAGPAAGHDRMKTKADPTGTKVIGMINNCAGGITPWGTFLSAKRTSTATSGQIAEDHPEAENYKRMGIPGNWYNWGAYYDRFDVSKEPNEANRFGWMVEIDPSTPPPPRRSAPPSAASSTRAPRASSTRMAASSSTWATTSASIMSTSSSPKGKFNPNDRAANMNLLDDGTLYVARFNESGKGEWLPLVHGQGKLTAENGFKSQADVVIHARKAADLLGATKMDRPEDIEPNPKTGKVYVMLTNNPTASPRMSRAANPRATTPSAISSR